MLFERLLQLKPMKPILLRVLKLRCAFRLMATITDKINACSLMINRIAEQG